MRFPMKATGFALVCFMMILEGAGARQINWRCPTNKNNVTSQGELMQEGFIFELGCFSPAFVPTLSNTDQWAEHWHFIERTGYREADKAFSSSAVITTNQGPLASGRQVYIWGYQADGLSGEWLLCKDASWTLPRPSSTGFPFTWEITAAVDTIVGTVNSTASPVFMQTASVSETTPLPVVLPNTWRAEMFTTSQINDAATSNWQADPDQDGLPNIMEYALGHDPLHPQTGDTMDLHLLPGQAGATLQLAPDRLVSTSIQISYDLAYWNDIGSSTVTNDPLTVAVTVSSHPPRAFFRVHSEWLLGQAP